MRGRETGEREGLKVIKDRGKTRECATDIGHTRKRILCVDPNIYMHTRRNPSSGCWRAVKRVGDVLQPPEAGWGEAVYVVVTTPPSSTASTT